MKLFKKAICQIQENFLFCVYLDSKLKIINMFTAKILTLHLLTFIISGQVLKTFLLKLNNPEQFKYLYSKKFSQAQLQNQYYYNNVDVEIYKDYNNGWNRDMNSQEIGQYLNNLEWDPFINQKIITWNTTNYLGTFIDDYRSKTWVQVLGDFFTISESVYLDKGYGSFNVFLHGADVSPNIQEKDILIYVSNPYELMATKITKKTPNIRRNSLDRRDTDVGVEYKIEFSITFNNSRRNQIFINLNLSNEDLVWGINNMVIKILNFKQVSCLVPSGLFQCAQCWRNMKLDSDENCVPIEGYQMAHLYDDFLISLAIRNKSLKDQKSDEYRDLEFQVTSDIQDNYLLKLFDYTTPSIMIQKLVHFFQNTDTLVYKFELEPNENQDFSIGTLTYDFQTISTIQPDEIDLSEVMVMLVRQQEFKDNKMILGEIYVENDERFYKKYQKKFIRENVNLNPSLISDDHRIDFHMNELFTQFERREFSKENIDFVWQDNCHLQFQFNLRSDAVFQDRLQGERQSFVLKLFVMGPQNQFILLNRSNESRDDVILAVQGYPQNTVLEFFNERQCVDDSHIKTSLDFVLVTEGVTSGDVKASSFLCDDSRCLGPQMNQLINFPGVNHMKVFIPDPSLEGTLKIEEITYTNNFDDQKRLMVIKGYQILPWRQSQIIISFYLNSLVNEGEFINIFIQYQFVLDDDKNLDQLSVVRSNSFQPIKNQYLRVQTSPYGTDDSDESFE